MERRSFFSGLVGVLTGWRLGGRDDVFDVEADLSKVTLLDALKQLGRPLGGPNTLLVVSPIDHFLAHELVPARGLQVQVIEGLPIKTDAWYVENGTHRVWGSRGGW